MLRTFVAPFDFHAPKGGRRRFLEFASTLSDRFATAPQILDDPVFSYTLVGRSQLDRLRNLDESRPAIVYLSNVVMHSALLILGDCDASDLMSPFCYDSIAAFINSPYTCGFGVGGDTNVKSAFDESTVVISDLARFRDDNDKLPDDGLFRILDQIADVFICNILNYERYFSHVSVFGDQPFFLNADSNVDFHTCVKKLENYSLREYLISQCVPFATLGDDHMDDEYAVSYGMDCWRFTDVLAFAR